MDEKRREVKTLERRISILQLELEFFFEIPSEDNRAREDKLCSRILRLEERYKALTGRYYVLKI